MAAHEDPFGWIGQTLESKYAIEELVGEGGFAVVYRGHHKGFDDKVAIKCLKIPRRLEGPDREQFLESFLAEGKLLHKLSKTDAGIVQALDVGAATSPNGSWTPFIVLEWLEGETLEEDLKKRKREGNPAGVGPRSLTEAIKLLEPAARALGTAHALGIAHRDVKPANLFCVAPQGANGKRTIKVVDFGIAKVLAESTDLVRAHEATGASIQAFTPRYAAPEQFDRRFGATGPWTDVFALALIVVEVVVGKSAMEGDTAQLFVASSNILHRPTLAAHGVDEGSGVEAVLERALAVDTKERYPTVTEFWAALEEAVATDETVLSMRAPDDTVKGSDSTKREAPQALATRTVGAAGPRSALAEVDGPPTSRSPQLLAAGAVAVVLSGALYFLTHREPARPENVVSVSPSPSAIATPVVVPTIPVPSILEASTSPSSAEKGFARWEDATYFFGVDYPDGLVADLAASDTKDGVVLVSAPKNAELRVFGGLLQNRTLDQMFDDAIRTDPTDDIGKRWITSKTKGDYAFEVTGNEGTRMFCLKTIVTTERSIWKYATMRFTFPVADRDRYEPALAHMLKSFTFRAN